MFVGGRLTRRLNLYKAKLVKRTPLSEGERLKILRRDAFCCVWCGETCQSNLTIDHTIPVAFGGTNDKDNLNTLCVGCHCEKSLIDQLVYDAAIHFGGEEKEFCFELKRVTVPKTKSPKPQAGAFEKSALSY
jgi:hypothetical protein